MRRITRSAATVLAAAATSLAALTIAAGPASAADPGVSLGYAMSTPVHGLTRTVQFRASVGHDPAVSLAGVVVDLWARTAGSPRWTEADHALTDAAGDVTLRTPGPRSTTYYQLRTVGDGHTEAAYSQVETVAGAHTRRCIATIRTRVTRPDHGWQTRWWAAPVGTGTQACQAPRGIPTTARAALRAAMGHHPQHGTWHATTHTRRVTELVSEGRVIGFRLHHVRVARIVRHVR